MSVFKHNSIFFSRRAAEQGLTQSQTQSSEPIKLSRNRLKSVMGECRALLQALGFECVVSSGEAEALCSQVIFVLEYIYSKSIAKILPMLFS